MHTTGQQLYHGRFTLVAPIGRGGSGTVWEARDAQTGNLVAIKLLIADAGGLAAVEREAEAAVRVRHPNAVQVLLTFEDADCAGVVMERCVASAADRVAAHGPIAPEAAVRMINAVLAALTAAHAAGVVHRDIKPANILLRADGSAALSDWGIARALFGSGVTHTTSIALLGTLPYLAPELRQDPRAASPATDLYAVGITLAWLLTGKVPPDPFVPAGEAVIRAGVPSGLAEVVLRACAWEPAERYASAAEMAEGVAGAGLGAELREVRAVVRKATGAAGVARRSMGPMWLAVGVLGLGVGWVGWGVRGVSEIEGVEGAAPLPACGGGVSQWVEDVRMGPLETTAAALGDLDGDGRLDAIFTNQAEATMSVWWGEPGRMPVERTDIPAGRSQWPAAVGDVDEDGTLDLVLGLQDDSAFAIVRGLGGRRFAEIEHVFQSPPPTQVALYDVNTDHHLDIVFSEPTGRMNVRLGDGKRWAGHKLLVTAQPETRLSGVVMLGRAPALALWDAAGAWTTTLRGEALPLAEGATQWIPALGAPGPVARTDHNLLIAYPTAVAPCALGPEASPWHIAAIGDLDGDDVYDGVAYASCRECTSNHVFVRGIPAVAEPGHP